jgi:hypothetical protein
LSQPEKKIVKWSDTKVDEIPDKQKESTTANSRRRREKKTPATKSREKQNAV